MNITELNNPSLNDIVMANEWASHFDWGDVIPGTISTLSERCVDYVDNKIVLSTRKELSPGFFYCENHREEQNNRYSTGAFITNKEFGYGEFTFDIEVESCLGLNFIAGLTTDAFDQYLLALKCNRDGSILERLIYKSVAMMNGETNKRNISVPFTKHFNVTIYWTPTISCVTINGIRGLVITDKDSIPYKGMRFSLVMTINDAIQDPHQLPYIHLNSFKYVKL